MVVLVVLTIWKLTKKWSLGLLIGYILIILGETVVFRTASNGEHFRPQLFWSYEVWEKTKEQVIANVVGFVPLGLIAGSIWKWKALVVGLGVSIVAEMLQLITHRGLFEFDDILHNSLGTLIGICAYVIFENRIKRKYN